MPTSEFVVDRATGVDRPLALQSAQIPSGSTALIVDAVETTPEPLDQLATRYGATIGRQPAAEVAAEATQKEADRVLRRRKRAEARAKVGAVKEKLHHG
jgi:hypothetical protein